MKPRFWIPPIPLVAGILFQVLAWCFVLVHAVFPSFGIELAWVHAVALGWLTVVALAVLLHVVPGFTDLAWRAEGVARGTVLVVCVAALALVVSFAASTPAGVAFAGIVLAAAIILYATLALWTLSGSAPDRRSATIARGLGMAVVALAVTALLGGQLSLGYAWSDARLLAGAPSHAVLGIAAWLTMLATGVSSRTFRPLLGAQSRWPKAHVISGGSLLVGSILAAATAPWSLDLFRAGLIIASAGVLAYVIDAADILRRAQTPHRAARAFVTASIVWLTTATALALAASWGAPVGRAAIVVALAGWLGQMVNAHLHHLGIRVVATYILGAEDETRPWTLLVPAWSWAALVTAQVAVLCTALRALGAPATFAWLGGGAGLLCMLAILANAAHAVRSARTFNQRATPTSSEA
jgi:hypothetical protein